MESSARQFGCNRYGCLVFAILFAGLVIFAILNAREASVRGKFSQAIVALRAAHTRLDEYYAQNHGFPPEALGRMHYGPLSDDLTTNISFHVEFPPENPVYKGPPIDAFRRKSLFPCERREKAWFRGRTNGRFTFVGYRPRYFRARGSAVVMLLSNGPDEDADLDAAVLELIADGDRETTSPNQEEVIIALRKHMYDATNGTISNGDVFRVVWPRE